MPSWNSQKQQSQKDTIVQKVQEELNQLIQEKPSKRCQSLASTRLIQKKGRILFVKGVTALSRNISKVR